MKKLYNLVLVLAPWAFLAGMLQFHFQSFLPYQGAFKGEHAFDYFTVIDFYVLFLVIVFLLGRRKKEISMEPRKIPKEFAWAILLLMIAGILEIFFQQIYQPVLNSPFDYFRSLFVYPIIFVLLVYKTVDHVTIDRMLKSYIGMILFFCAFALLQHVTGIFPGEQKDFTGRLVWPFIDYVTLKSSSANWVAFFVTPSVVISFINVFHLLRKKIYDRQLYFYVIALFLSTIVVYLTQSYGAYIAIFGTLTLYMFRALPLKKFLIALMVTLFAAGGVYFLQQSTYKYQIMTGQKNYRYDTSVASRGDIYRMNLAMILEHPILGVGLNAYQSYFTLNHERILGHKYNESHIPPHAHNFFMSFWTNLGVFGFLAMLILIVGIFWRYKFKADNPAVFVLLAVMIHGLIDSYYWKQEIAYIFWMMVVLSYLYRLKSEETKKLTKKSDSR